MGCIYVRVAKLTPRSTVMVFVSVVLVQIICFVMH